MIKVSNLIFSVFLELKKALNNKSSTGTVPNIKRWNTHPRLHLIERERYILSKLLIEHPNLTVNSRLRNTVAVIMKQNSIVLGVSPQRRAQLLHVVGGRIERLLVSSARLPPFILLLQLGSDRFERLLRRRCHRVDPALEFRAVRRLDDVRRVHADVEAEHERCRHCLHFLFHAP